MIKIISDKYNKEEYIKFGKMRENNKIITIEIKSPQHKYLEFGQGGDRNGNFMIICGSYDGDEEFSNRYYLNGLEFKSNYDLLTFPLRHAYIIVLVPIDEYILNESGEIEWTML